MISGLAIAGALAGGSELPVSSVDTYRLTNPDRVGIAVEAAQKIIDEGVLTVYDMDVWEREIWIRTGYAYPGYYFEEPSPVYNPEIASDPELMKLVQEGNIIAVNPAMISVAYMELLESLVDKAQQDGFDDERIRKIILDNNEEFTEYAYRDVLGRVLTVTAAGIRPVAVVVMSVFSPIHAAEDLGLIGSKDVKTNAFVGDVHNVFMEKVFGISFDYDLGWWVDREGNGIPVKDVPWINLSPKSDTTETPSQDGRLNAKFHPL